MKPILACVFAIAMMMGSSAAYAVQPDEIMSDPAMETRARNGNASQEQRTNRDNPKKL